MRRRIINASVFLCLFFFISSLMGQNHKRFSHITIDNGLAHTDALCFAQDDAGFIWIGTNSGLHRYDGYELIQYFNKLSIIDQVYDNRVISLEVFDQDIWMGTEGGLYYFSLIDDRFVPIKYNDVSRKSFNSKIKQVKKFDNKIWFIAEGELYFTDFKKDTYELDVFPFDGFKNLNEPYLDDVEVLHISSDSGSNLFIGTNYGLIIYDKDINRTHLIKRLVSDNNPDSNQVLYSNYSSGNLWLLTDDNLIAYPFVSLNNFKGGLSKKHTFKGLFNLANSKTTHQLTAFVIDPLGNLWASSAGGLLSIADPLTQNPKVELYRRASYDKYAISNNHIATVFVDKSQCLWLGTWGGGVNILDLNQKKFNLALPSPGNIVEYSVSQPFIRAIAEDDNNLIWIGLKNDGIRIYNPATGELSERYNKQEINTKLSNKNIHSLAAIDGAIIIGTMNGLNIYELATGKVYKHLHDLNDENSIASKEIYCLATDSFGAIWMGTWGDGLNRIFLDKNYNIVSVDHFVSHQGAFKIGSNTVTYLLSDIEKNEVLVSTSRGLSRFILNKEGKVVRSVLYRGVDDRNTLSSEYIWPIVKENDSTYWLGTLGGGLNRIVLRDSIDMNNRGSYIAQNFNVNDGLMGNDVESLLMDNKGNFWLGGTGLSKFDPSSESFWTFDTNDGLQSKGFKIGAAFKAKDGRLYFGGINGLNYFYPDEIVRNEIKPQPIIASIRIREKTIKPGEVVNGRVIFDRAISYVNTLVLKHNENDFSFSFSAAHFVNPGKCKFRYKLNDRDSDWIYLTAGYPVVYFSNLEYGSYVLEVEASNHDGVWSDNASMLNIVISPPWWKSKYALIMYLIIYFSIALAIYYYIAKLATIRNNLKLSKAQEQKNEELMQLKLQFFTNISHEFKTPLSLIMVPVERIINEKLSNDEQQKLLKVVYNNSKRLYYLINELIDFRKAEVGELKLHRRHLNFNDFVKGIVETFRDSDKMRENKLHFSSSVSEMLWFDPDKMSNIVYNLLSNAIKFSDNKTDIFIDLFTGTYENIKPAYKHVFEEFNADRNASYMFFRIKDEGVGISKTSISKVFLRFYQISDTGSSHLGSGIGLALVRSLVLLHKGVILVSSERGKGAEFIVGFPININIQEDINDEIDGVSDDINGNLVVPGFKDMINAEYDNESEIDDIGNLKEKEEKPTLVIVEDNDELRNLLCDTFSGSYNVIDAVNGVEALQLILENIPDLIISDLMMPKMDGLELLRKIRADINTSHIPVIILTAKTSIESQIEGIESGADLYIPKPFSLRLLQTQVSKLSKSRKQLREKYSNDVFSDCRELARNSKDKDFLDHFIKKINSEMDNSDFSVENLTKELGIGRTNLYRKIKSLTGQSMGDFIRDTRLKKAASILVTEDISISEVIYRVGLNSNSYFTKAFKQKFGMTPSEFIQKNRRVN